MVSLADDVASSLPIDEPCESVYYLPAELLVAIFNELLDTSPPSHSHLIRATHVCRYWRAVAIGSATLWTTIEAHLPDPTQEFLARSQDLPLNVSLSGKRHRVDKIGPILADHVHRFRTLAIHLPERSSLKELLEWINRPVPLLRDLTLDNIRDIHTPIVTHGLRITSFNPFHGQLHSLKSLTLRHVSLPFLSSRPATTTTLTSLTLVELLPDLPVFLNFLGTCPDLQQLAFQQANRFYEYPQVGPLPAKVSLPRLGNLILQLYPASANGNFLSHLILPKQTRVMITTDATDATFTAAEDVYNMFPEDTTTLPCLQAFNELDLSYKESQRSTYIRARGVSSLILNIDVPSTRSKHFLLHPRSSVFRDLDRLSIGGVDRFSDREWRQMLAQIPSLGVLSARSLEGSSHDILAALSSSPNPSQPILCPSLHTLCLGDVLPSAVFNTLLEAVIALRSGTLKKIDIGLHIKSSYTLESTLRSKAAVSGVALSVRMLEEDE